MSKEEESGRPVFFEAHFMCSLFFFFKKKNHGQNVVIVQSHEKGPGHKQIMEIQRPPEVTSKTQFPVRKEARWTFLIFEENSLVNLLSTRGGLKNSLSCQERSVMDNFS